MDGPSAAWFRGTQARREGHIRAGSIDKDVTFVFVDAGDQVNDQVNDQVDTAYRAKYRRHAASIIGHIVSAEARSATIRLAPGPTSFNSRTSRS